MRRGSEGVIGVAGVMLPAFLKGNGQVAHRVPFHTGVHIVERVRLKVIGIVQAVDVQVNPTHIADHPGLRLDDGKFLVVNTEIADDF